MSNLFIVSYDNFYLSRDIVDISNIKKFIEKQIEIDCNGQYSGLFSCNFSEDYKDYELEKIEENEYKLTLFFNENDNIETRSVNLIKANMFL